MQQFCSKLIKGYRIRLFIKTILQINAYLLIAYLVASIALVISGLPYVPLGFVFLIILSSIAASGAVALVKKELFIVRELDFINGLYQELLTLYQLNVHNVFADKIADKIRGGNHALKSLSINPAPNILQICLSVLLIWFIHTGTYAVDESGMDGNSIAVSGESVRHGFEMDILAFPRSGTAPLSVIFQPRVEKRIKIDLYQWNFGDKYYSQGGISSDITPVHKYNVPGIYTVSLIIESSGKSYKIIKEDYIIVSSGGRQGGEGADDNPMVDNKKINNPGLDPEQIKNRGDEGGFKIDPKVVDLESKTSGDIEREMSKMLGSQGGSENDYESLYNDIRSFSYKRGPLIENISIFDSEFLELFYQNLLEGDSSDK